MQEMDEHCLRGNRFTLQLYLCLGLLDAKP